MEMNGCQARLLSPGHATSGAAAPSSLRRIRKLLEPGAWNDPRRPPSWPAEVCPSVPPGRPLAHTLRFSAGVLGWPLILAFALSLSPDLLEVRALAVAFAVALLVGERWREAERRRRELELELFLRALDGPAPIASPPRIPFSMAMAMPQALAAQEAYGATVDACLEGHRPRGRLRRRPTVDAREEEGGPASASRPVQRGDAPTRIERASECDRPTIPDSVRTIHVGLVHRDEP